MSEADPISLPASGPDGITWRPPVTADVSAIVALHDICCDADNTYRTAPSEILDHWDSQDLVPSTDSLIGLTDDGELAATIWSIVSSTAETQRRAFGHENRIHPEYRTDALRDFTLGWWEARSRQRFAEHDDDLPRALYHYVYTHQTSEIEYLESRGYEIVRYYHELGRSLAEPLDAVPFPPGIDVRSMDAHRDDALTVHNAAFRDHWGSQPMSTERWHETFTEFYAPDASYVAYDGEVPVAYLLSSMYPHDFEDRGWSHFWVEGVGTLRPYRRRGVASSLVSLAMEARRSHGMEYALLGVDAENPTGAYGVYEKLGFRQLRAEVALEKKV